ncbi:MAG: T9SS type A sorting domain-containing protein, partial [Sphingobacteriales bacterium]
FNAQGVLVARQYDVNQPELRMNLAHLATGIYYARVQTSGSIEVLKVIKE